ncbi:MAG: mechanosensitive ion channel [Lewinellaceae bacterium]|nr:mechanosensitive ion channel [Lewinellaceae bacterium]
MPEEILQYLQTPNARQLFGLVVGAVVLITVVFLAKRLVPRYVEAAQSRYRLRKFITFAGYLVFIIFLFVIYSKQLSGLTVFLGVAGAGVAFALQEVIASFAGFLAINTSSFYKVGDRVMLGGIKGDVIDIGFLRTTIMQIGDWVSSDQYNGKIVRIANSFIFKEPVFNYSGDFPFLWDEIQIPIRTYSDYRYGKKVFLEILEETQGEYARSAAIAWRGMTTRFMVEDAKVTPGVTISFNENWITFTLRYVVDYKMRNVTKDLLYGKILDAIKASDGRLAVASTAMEVTNIHATPPAPK